MIKNENLNVVEFSILFLKRSNNWFTIRVNIVITLTHVQRIKINRMITLIKEVNFLASF